MPMMNSSTIAKRRGFLVIASVAENPPMKGLSGEEGSWGQRRRRDNLESFSVQCVGRLLVSLLIRKRAMLRKGVRRQRSWVSDTGFLKWQNPPRETFWERGVLPSWGRRWLLAGSGCGVRSRRLAARPAGALCSGSVFWAIWAQKPAGRRRFFRIEVLLVRREFAQPRIARELPFLRVHWAQELPHLWFLGLLRGIPGLAHTAGKVLHRLSGWENKSSGTPSLRIYSVLGS